ncbi:hypothetical protein [Streptomyces cyaneofuscatus]|uniref:hypothetical protein n=1 Tax=Streptomyces cyaneofuscatus TaxID=66883 RepID=UPI0036806251
MLTIGNGDVRRLLDDREREVLDAVREAYLLHAAEDTSLPHSVFLRFPDDPGNRIIGLPAYLGGAEPLAGMKWIASFPGNVAEGLERASAAIIVNSMRTGRPVALVEGSTISARRTAASAALAAVSLPSEDGQETGVSLIGCGVINFEVLRFLLVVRPEITDITVHDLDAQRAADFRDRCSAELAGDGRVVRVAGWAPRGRGPPPPGAGRCPWCSRRPAPDRPRCTSSSRPYRTAPQPRRTGTAPDPTSTRPGTRTTVSRW